jgi:hypothetical protein
MVDLEYANAGIWIPAGERVKAGTEDDVLRDASFDRRSQRVLSELTPGDEEGPERRCNGRAIIVTRRSTQASRDFLPKHRKRQRIPKDDWIVEQLMCRTTLRHALRGPACLILVHFEHTVASISCWR